MAKELIWVEAELVQKIDIIQDIIKLKGEDISKAINKLVESTDILKTADIDTTKINQIKDTFSELSSSIKECSNSLDRWEMNKFSDAMDLIDKYNRYSDEEKELLKGLMKSE